MEYQVPQFIEVEDKLIGPLTFRQFIYLAGAGGLCIVFFAYLPVLLALLFSGLFVALAVTLAFYKMNGKTFIEVLEAGFSYYTGGKFFLWKHKELTQREQHTAATTAAAEAEAARPLAAGTPKLTRGKLAELAWSIDVQHGNSDDDEPKK
ncbi:MAG: hypothetical protein RLZZ26_607 [Candidatus Parcubacteria bacterium]|jgi:hypothetical protein